MPIAKFDALQKLAASLSKAEKRHFVLYVNRLSSNKQVLFLKLFQLMDKYPQQLESFYFDKLASVTKPQFLNAKRHLYKQLLKSLRLLSEDSEEHFSIRQKIDFADILYKRGQYYESLAILNTIRQKSSSLNGLLYLQVCELKKKIESRHITRSRKDKNRIESLITDASGLQEKVAIESRLSSISLQIQGLYIKWGFAKDERDALMYKVFFNSHLPPLKSVKSSTLATVLWHQSHVWFHYMSLNFHLSYKHAVSWVELMGKHPSLKQDDPDLFMRGFHYILTNCFYLGRSDKFEYWISRYREFRKEHLQHMNATTRLLDFCYYDNAEMNYMIIKNKYPRLSTYTLQLESRMLEQKGKLDEHRIMIFYYKLSLIFSYRGDYQTAIEYLNRIIDQPEKQLRADIFSYARLVHLMCHYRINNFNLVLNLLPSVKATFESNNRTNPVVDQMIGFLRKGSNALNFGIGDLIDGSKSKIESHKKERYSKVAFLYYDFTNWLESVRKAVSIEKVKKTIS